MLVYCCCCFFLCYSDYRTALMWIGANKKSGSWMWFGILTGRVPPDETHPDSDWHSGHLDDAGYDCMYYQPTSDGWNAHRYCSSSFNFVCEKRIWKYKQQRAKLSLNFYFHHLSDNQINLNYSSRVTRQGGQLMKQSTIPLVKIFMGTMYMSVDIKLIVNFGHLNIYAKRDCSKFLAFTLGLKLLLLY